MLDRLNSTWLDSGSWCDEYLLITETGRSFNNDRDDWFSCGQYIMRTGRQHGVNI